MLAARRFHVSRSTLGSGRAYSTKPDFDTTCVLRDTLVESKQKRFGSQLETFKDMFEKPVTDAFNEIQSIKKTLSNRQARWMIRTSKNGQRKGPKPPKRRDARDKWHAWETRFLKKAYDSLDQDDGDQSILSGETSKQRRVREKFLAAVTTGTRFQEVRDPSSLDDPVCRPRTDPGRPNLRAWKYENNLEDGDLAQIIAEQLEAHGLIPDWKMWLGKAQTQMAREQEKKLWEDKLVHLSLKDTTYLTENDVEPGRPAVLRPLIGSIAPKKPKAAHIEKCGDKYPIAFETTHWPLDMDIYNPYNTRKVTMFVRYRAIRLPAAVKNRLLDLCEQYHDKNKGLIVIPCSKKRTMAENKEWCVNTFRQMMREAWKVDLNFIPAKGDNLLPHQQVAKELTEAPELEAKKFHDSFDSIVQAADQLTMFSFPHLPNLGQLREDKEDKEVYLNRWNFVGKE